MSAKKMIRAVGYARRSKDMQETSIVDQRAYVEKWAAANSYRILRWFIDDGISGTSARGREAFERLLHDAENGRDFETVLVYDISRFSRGGTNETGFYLHRLKMAGVDVVFCAEGIPAGDEGELLQGVKSWQARQYSVKLARDSIRGQLSHITRHKSRLGSQAPYGYDRQYLAADGKILRILREMPDGSRQELAPDGTLLRVLPRGESLPKAKSDIVRLVPGPAERVRTVQQMFEWCAGGTGIRTIAMRLNAGGVRTPRGRRWEHTSVASILRNPVFKGALVWNRVRQQLLGEDLLPFPRLQYTDTFRRDFKSAAQKERAELQEVLAKVAGMLEDKNGDTSALKQDGGLQYDVYTNKHTEDGKSIGHFRVSKSRRVSCTAEDGALRLRRYGEHSINDNP